MSEDKTFQERSLEERKKFFVEPRLQKKLEKYGVQTKLSDFDSRVFKPGSEFVPLTSFMGAKGIRLDEIEEGVFERRDPPEIVAVQNLHMEKDATNYDLLVFKLKGSFGFGMCGNVTDGFLVIDGLNRRAYLLPGFIPDAGYVGEKFSGGNTLSRKDIENVILLMKVALAGGSE